MREYISSFLKKAVRGLAIGIWALLQIGFNSGLRSARELFPPSTIEQAALPYRPTFKSRSVNIGSNPSALLEQPIPPYKGRPYSTVPNPSSRPAEKALKRVAAGASHSGWRRRLQRSTAAGGPGTATTKVYVEVVFSYKAVYKMIGYVWSFFNSIVGAYRCAWAGH